MIRSRVRMVWAILGVLTVGYAISTFAYLATWPDLRIRCLLSNPSHQISTAASVGTDEVRSGSHVGPEEPSVEVKETIQIECRGPELQEGDRLKRIGDRRTRHFLDVVDATEDLRHARVNENAQLDSLITPEERERSFGIPSLIEVGRARYVEVEFTRPGQSASYRTWVLVQNAPLRGLVLTFVWMLIQLGMFAVGALGYWNRPFDRAARLFYAICMLTVGVVVGCSYWWVLAGTVWLSIPLVVCGVLVPAVTLHFYLVYPRSKRIVQRFPKTALLAVYLLPTAGGLWLSSKIGYLELFLDTSRSATVVDVLHQLDVLRRGIYVYVAAAAGYFLLTLACQVHSLMTTSNPNEYAQVKWILWAGMIAAAPLAYVVQLAVTDRVAFAFGGVRLPLFLGSLALSLAYAIGVMRYKLMLIDQVVGKGTLYYVASVGLAIGFGAIVALGSLIDRIVGLSLSSPEALGVGAVLAVFVVFLLWIRDLLQQAVDRRFFREKYQLDRALQRLNRAVVSDVDPDGLADMMLGTCRDVLGTERAALYLRTSSGREFELAASHGSEGLPSRFAPDTEFLESLQEGGSVQRVTPGTRAEMSPVQTVLRNLDADLVHALELDGGVDGLVVLGGGGRTSFTAEDLTFLNALAQVTKVALHSARIHRNVARISEELKDKTERVVEQNRRIAMMQTELTGGSVRAGADSLTPGGGVEEFHRDAFKGESPAVHQVLATARKVAASESTVLIRGESGTGKEMLARVLHENSPRRDGPHIRVHCASLSPSLLESELFGHVKGAFTGAYRDKIGRFEAANGGTLFLDEIGDISLETQIKLLRVLQERNFEPVGSTRTVQTDVRLVTATHQNLERLISEGSFREDLYYRLNVISITLPPLRERLEDVFELALHFLKRAAKRTGRHVTHIDEGALRALEQYAWPGNVRELENVIERAVVLTEDEAVTLAELPADLLGGRSPERGRSTRGEGETVPAGGRATAAGRPRQSPASPSDAPWETPANGRARNGVAGSRTLGASEPDEFSERQALLNALEQSDGNKAKAARLMGMPRSTYFSKLKKYDLA